MQRKTRSQEMADNKQCIITSLDGDTVATLVRLIAGEVAIDLRAPGNSKLLVGAELLGIVPSIPSPPISLASLMGQV